MKQASVLRQEELWKHGSLQRDSGHMERSEKMGEK